MPNLTTTMSRARTAARAVLGWMPLTPAGMALAAAVPLLYRYGVVGRQDLLLAGAIPCLEMLLGTSLVLTVAAALLARMSLRRARTRAGLDLEVGQASPTGFDFRFPRWLPLVEIAAAWEHPGDCALERDGRWLRETFLPRRRGAIERLRRTLIFRDALGLAEVRWTVRETVDVRVLPARRGVDPGQIPPALAEGGELANPAGTLAGDLIEMRNYAPGDPLRLVLWKVYARTRKLVVRTPEPAYEERGKLCAWFVPGEDDEEAAALARAVIEGGRLGEGWALGAESVPGVAGAPPAALDLLARSVTAAPAGLAAFREFAARMRGRGFSACVVIGPASRRGDIEALNAEPFVSEVLIAGRPAGVPMARWRRMVFATPPAGNLP